MSTAAPYSVPEESGALQAVLLAVAVHAALLAFLWFGIRWQSETPVAVEAEVWNVTTSEAAPPPPPPAPEPVAVKETPKPVEAPVEKPDIALEQEKKRKEQALRQEQLQKQEEAKRLDNEKKEREQEEKIRKLREQDLKRMMAQADIGHGSVAKNQGPGDPAYANLIAAKIRSNTVFPPPPGVNGNPEVEYELYLLPDGSVRQVRLLKPSGLPGFDEAVRNAIDKSQPFPADKSGIVPREVIVNHRLMEN